MQRIALGEALPDSAEAVAVASPELALAARFAESGDGGAMALLDAAELRSAAYRGV
jgi:hypothetical protein